MPKQTAAAKRSKRLASVAHLAFIEKAKGINRPEKPVLQKLNPKTPRPSSASPIQHTPECLPGPTGENRNQRIRAGAKMKESNKRKLQIPPIDAGNVKGSDDEDNPQIRVPEKLEQPRTSGVLVPECLPGPSDESRNQRIRAEAKIKESDKRQLQISPIDAGNVKGSDDEDNPQIRVPEKLEQPRTSVVLVHECLPGPSDESRRKRLQAETKNKRQIKIPHEDSGDVGSDVEDNQQIDDESEVLCTQESAGELGSSDDEPEDMADPEPDGSEVQRLKKRIKKLQQDNTRLTALNFSLQEALMKKPEGKRFLDVEGFPNSEWLMKASVTANDSDYIFVKELMVKLWPTGCGNATVTGKKSNNPSGISRNNVGGKTEAAGEPDVPKLDPVKVDYIKDRVFERRLIMLDQYHTAQLMAKQVPKHIARALSNNPKLRITNVNYRK